MGLRIYDKQTPIRKRKGGHTMSFCCSVCGKGKLSGGTITRRGLAKKKGGIGTHVVKNNKRVYRPNLQRIRVKTPSGSKRMYVCSACIKHGKVEKVVR